MNEPPVSGFEPRAISRRALLQSASAVAVAGMMGGRSFGESANSAMGGERQGQSLSRKVSVGLRHCWPSS